MILRNGTGNERKGVSPHPRGWGERVRHASRQRIRITPSASIIVAPWLIMLLTSPGTAIAPRLFVNNMMSQGATMIDADGVVRMRCREA